MSTERIGIEILDNKTKLYVENIKCGGCAGTITEALEKLGVEEIEVSPDDSTVIFNSTSESTLNESLDKLKSLGYPLVDTVEGFEALTSKAKSYVSCAIGKMKN